MQFANIPSQSALARESGIPQPTINRILKGVGKKGPETNTIVALARACKVSAQWLLDGTGPMTLPNEEGLNADSRVAVDVKDDNANTFVQIAVVKSFLHAGFDGTDGDFEPDEDEQLTIPRSWLEERGVNPEFVRALRIKGLSMFPTLRPGAIAFVNLADRTPIEGKLFAVNLKAEGKSVVKRLERSGGLWYLASDNDAPEFRSRPVLDGEIVLAGRVAWAIQDFF